MAARGVTATSGVPKEARVKPRGLAAGARSHQQGPQLLRFRTVAIRTRGPQALQAWLRPIKDTQNIPRPEKYLGGPQDGPGLRAVISNINEAEWRVFWALITLGLQSDLDFIYQASAQGGRTQAGGSVPDFLLPAFGLVLSVIGVHFHYGSTAQSGRDLIIAAGLAGQGFATIGILEQDAMQRPRAVVAASLRYEDWSHGGQP